MHSDFSQAFNFDEAVLHDVDPRTGAYPVIFSFEDIVSHDFYGARFTLKLKNDPLDMTNYGFGRTWAPMLTRYDKKNGKLFTSDGRQYDFDGTNLLRHYDVNNFLIRKNEAEKTIDIIYRSGVTERCGTENDVNYMTTLFSPEGKKLRFLYSPLSSENETIYRLEKVMDESVPRSLEIRYLTENEVLIIYRRKDYIYQAYQCRIWNGQLYFVSLPNVTEFGTSISYQNINNGLYISKLTMSTGYTETISYDAGHKLPPGNPHLSDFPIRHNLQMLYRTAR